MSKRIISGLVGAFFALAILVFNQTNLWLINFVTSVISMLAMKEIFSVLGIHKLYSLTIPTLIFVSSLFVTGFSMEWEIVWYLYTVIIFSGMMWNKNFKLKETCIVYSMAILISFSLFKIVALRDYGGKYGSFYVFLALSIAWTSDTGAYFCGKYFGKSKLCPEISPKKTIEGFIGGITVCLVCLILISMAFNNFIFPQKQQINYILVVILGFIGSLISSLGDLCFSTIKRKCGVKDFGNLMPGHGGILDRFDSVIFVAPYVYIFLQLIPIIY